MSNKGKNRRGKTYYNYRDRDDNLPQWVKGNSSRMSDVQYYLDNLPKETKSKEKK